MKHCSLLGGLLLAWLVPQAAPAGDRWHECSMINDSVFEYDGEMLFAVDGDERKELPHSKINRIVISEEEGYCETKDGNRFNWGTHVYVVKLDVAGTGGPFKLWAICEEGGSGFPATDEIDTTCVTNVMTRNRQLVPAYEDLAGE
jgi:hypothetical protein